MKLCEHQTTLGLCPSECRYVEGFNEGVEEAAKLLDEDCRRLAARGAHIPALQASMHAVKVRALKA